YGADRPHGRPLWLGSVKSNLGHTQAAAGAAGVIKMIQAIRHGKLPATLHVDEPTPHVDWSCGTVRLLTEARRWPDADRPRRAGVSSFGASGTNAHVIIEQGDPLVKPAPRPEASGPVVWPLSGRSSAALRDQAIRLRDHLSMTPGWDPASVGRALATTRTAFPHRAAVVGQTSQELLGSLSALAAQTPSASVFRGQAQDGMLAFLFEGQGTQRPSMGLDAARAFPAFADALSAVHENFDA